MLRIVTFGEATIWLGRERVAPSASRMFALGLYLGAERGRDVPRPVLQALLFPESDERSASHSLRQLVYRMRQLGAQIESSADSIAIDTERVSDDYTALLSAPELEPQQIELATKGFMPGYAPGFSEAFSDWVDGFRGRTTLEIRRKALAAMEDARARCSWAAVAHAARACLALDPLNEDATIGLAESLAMTGSKAEALARLDRYEAELPPAAQECRAAARRLRQRIASRVAEPSPVSLRDLPLVGREEEMRRLMTALAHTRANGGGVVLITGEPGIGKTRLITEFARVAALSGAQTARVVCRAATSHQPLSPFIELTRQLLQMPGALGCSPEALEALRGLSHHTPRATGSADTGMFDAESVFQAHTSAILDLIDAVATESHLLLVVDDAHWLDEASVEALLSVLAAIEQHPCMLVLVGRTGWSLTGHFLADGIRAIRIQLPPLEREHALSLLATCTGTSVCNTGTETREWMLRCSRGNPLFLQLIARQGMGGGEARKVPFAIADLLKQRIESLDAEARSVADACAILGRHATATNLELVLELPALVLISVLRELQSLGLVETQDHRITIGHPLASDILAQLMPGSVELILRRRIALLLSEECSRSGDVTALWDCADHWEFVGDADRAATALRDCAAHALNLGRPSTGSRALQRALALASVSPHVRREVLRDAALCCGVLGEWGRIEQLLTELESMPSELPCFALDPSTAVLQLEARRASDAGHSNSSDPWRILVDDRAPSDTRLRAAAFLAAYAEDTFDAGLANATREQVQMCLGDAESTQWSSRQFWIIYHTCFGSPLVARRIARDALSHLGSRSGSPRVINHHYNVAHALGRTGLHQEASDLLKRLLEQLRGWELASQEAWCCAWLAWLAVGVSNWSEARSWTDQAARATSRAGTPTPVIQRFAEVDLALQAGDAERAGALIRELRAEGSSPNPPRRQLHLAQLRVRAKRLVGMPATDAELEVLTAGHVAARSLGLHDDVALALCQSLSDRRQESVAAAYLNDYLANYRRDLFAIPRELAAVARSLGVSVPRYDSESDAKPR